MCIVALEEMKNVRFCCGKYWEVCTVCVRDVLDMRRICTYIMRVMINLLCCYER
jgi:hypothetical protein